VNRTLFGADDIFECEHAHRKKLNQNKNGSIEVRKKLSAVSDNNVKGERGELANIVIVSLIINEKKTDMKKREKCNHVFLSP
jgi:hypothetical protein